MAEHSKFFDSLNPLDPDKVYTADEFIGYFGKLITDGIMKGEANMLKVETSGSNMNTTVDTGTAFLLAREYENDSKLSLTHEIEALGKSRIDRVVIRLMLGVDYREAKAFVKKGAAGTSPIAPPLERTGDVYEISLAQVKVIGGQTYINVADVVDERGKDVIAPWAGSRILPNFDDAALQELVEKVESLVIPYDSGYVDVPTVSPFGNMLPIKIRQTGNIVSVSGFLKVVDAINSNVICSLPALAKSRMFFTFNILRTRGSFNETISGLCNGSHLMVLTEDLATLSIGDFVQFNFTYQATTDGSS